MNILKEFMANDSCSYLQDKTQTTHYKIIQECSISYNEELIERGYRRFGRVFFRPECTSCDECKSIKVDTHNFTFSKSARRVMKKASNIKSYIQKPTISKEHLDLFEKYHQLDHDQ